MADDEIVVEIEGESAETPPPEKKTDSDPLSELQAQLSERQAETERERAAKEAERTRADQEARKREEAERQVEAARGEVTESQLATVEQGLAAARAASDAAYAEHLAASEAGDWKKLADAQVKLTDARLDIKRFHEAKADLEAKKAAPPERQERRTEAPVERTAQADPVEDFLARCSPQTAKWLRDHPDDAKVLATGSDPRRRAKMNAAHNDALGEGIDLDTPEYFAHVEKFLGMTKAPPANGKTPPPRRASAPPAAPVGNVGGGGMNGGGTEVRLTKGEAQAATDGTLYWNYDDPSGQKRFKKGDPIGIQEYARRKKALQEQGQYDKSFYEG